MNTRDIGFKNERIERLVRARTGGRLWRVTEAKVRLSEIIQHARKGGAQLIGTRDPVVLISIRDLESLITAFGEPETWGERFSPPVTEKGLGKPLELPIRSRSVVDSYDIQGEYPNGPVTEDEDSGRPTPKRGVD